MTKDVVLFGAGDFARVASVYLDRDSERKVVGFTVHEAFRTEPALRGKPVIPFEKLRVEYPPSQIDMFVAVGFRNLNKARAEIYQACKALGYSLITYINSKANLWGEVEMGDNVFILENVTLQPFVRIGCDTLIWSGSFIGHDSTIGSHCFVGPSAAVAGNSAVGDHCFIGINATIRDHVRIGARSVIGAGGLVLTDVAEQSVVRGCEPDLSKRSSHRLRAI
jgi:sugar O-acyltransferase (sialic acid O-acetyltransferase NeuD family)